MEQQIPIFSTTDRQNAELARRFFAAYTDCFFVQHPDKKLYLGKRTPRACRFCGKAGRGGAAQFVSKAHVIPQFMGNRNLLSYFECDACNDHFNKYETSFAHFIGASRTIALLKGQGNQVPKFVDQDGGLTLEQVRDSLCLYLNEELSGVILDQEHKEIAISTIRHDYVPIHILKVLVKIGLCLLDDDEVADYEVARQFVMSDAHDTAFAGNAMLRLHLYVLPGPAWLDPPAAYLFTLNAASAEPFPHKQLVLTFGNYCYQLALPFGKADNERLMGKKVQLPRFPVPVEPEVLRCYGEYQDIVGDFTSTQVRHQEPHEITVSFREFILADPSEDEPASVPEPGNRPVAE